MAKKEEESSEIGILSKVGPWAFILGMVVAFVSALSKEVFWGLGALGLVVGLLNITDKELSLYLLASLTFLVSANALSVTLSKLLAILPLLSTWLAFIDPLLANITLFVAPGAAVVALKGLYNLAKD
jgi:hypothetical protein